MEQLNSYQLPGLSDGEGIAFVWCRGPESNWLRPPFQGGALPMSYPGRFELFNFRDDGGCCQFGLDPYASNKVGHHSCKQGNQPKIASPASPSHAERRLSHKSYQQ